MNRTNAARFEGWISIVVNILLFILKFWAGFISGSLALTADAWHTLSDSITSIIVLVSSHISTKPPDKEHPYGHGRAEIIASLAIGILLAVISFEFLREAVIRFQQQKEAVFGSLALIAVGSSIIFKQALGIFALTLGKKFNLMSLRADGRHHQSDALSSVVVLAGIFISAKFWWMDSLLTVLVAFLIGLAAFDVLKNSANSLLGRKAESQTVKLVENICSVQQKKWNISLYPHHFHEHVYGQHTELTFHVFMPGDWTIKHGHKIIKEIEEELHSLHHIEATIHIDPAEEADNA